MLAAVTVVLTTLGAWRTDLTGYGTKTQLAIGIGVMLIAVLLWIYRQRVEERRPVQWRDTSVSDPSELGHPPDAVAAAGSAGESSMSWTIALLRSWRMLDERSVA